MEGNSNDIANQNFGDYFSSKVEDLLHLKRADLDYKAKETTLELFEKLGAHRLAYIEVNYSKDIVDCHGFGAKPDYREAIGRVIGVLSHDVPKEGSQNITLFENDKFIALNGGGNEWHGWRDSRKGFSVLSNELSKVNVVEFKEEREISD